MRLPEKRNGELPYIRQGTSYGPLPVACVTNEAVCISCAAERRVGNIKQATVFEDYLAVTNTATRKTCFKIEKPCDRQ